MVKKIQLLCFGVYLFFWLGLIFHTTNPPIVLGKYSVEYFIALIALGLLYIPFCLYIQFLLKPSEYELSSGKTFSLSFKHKVRMSLVGLGVLLLIAEVTLGFKYGPQDSDTFLNEFHPFLQNRLDSKLPSLHVNRHGFRGEDIDKKKPNDVFRIFVLGGSTVLSSRVDYEKSHVRILETLLKSHYNAKKIGIVKYV